MKGYGVEGMMVLENGVWRYVMKCGVAVVSGVIV